MTTHDFEDGNGPVPAHQHPRGQGWVADTATVTPESYVGVRARVFGNACVRNGSVFGYAKVYGDAGVYGHAQVFDRAEVCGNAKIRGTALVYDIARVYGDALVCGNAWVYGDVRVYGDFQINNGKLYTGHYSSILDVLDNLEL